MEYRVNLRGEGEFCLTLGVKGYEYPDSVSGVDADWLVGSIRVQKHPGLELRAFLEVSWRADELGAFADALGLVVRGERLAAELKHMECQVELEVQAKKFSGYITDGLQTRIDFSDVSMEIADLRNAHQQLARIATAFPSRGLLR